MNANGTFRYDARGATALQALDVGQSLTDTFTYRASDGIFLSSAATVTITVQGRNDAPTAVTDLQFTDQNKTIDINVVANDLDPEKHPLTVTGVSGGIGQVTINATLNRVQYNPNGKFNNLNTGQSATDTFTYQVSDGRGGVATGTVIVTIFGLNDPPVAVTDQWTSQNPIARTTEQSPVIIPVLANDTDPEGTKLTVTAVQLVGTKGLVTINVARLVRQHRHVQPQRQVRIAGRGADRHGYVPVHGQGRGRVHVGRHGDGHHRRAERRSHGRATTPESAWPATARS